MKKLIYLIVVLVALGLIVAGCLPTVPPAEQGELSSLTKANSTIYVDDDGTPGVDCDYNTIQEAIEADTTVDGDTIDVAAGTYDIGYSYAYPGFTIDKEITLQGVNRYTTFIDGQLSSQTIKITASNVTITGFTFCNSRYHDLVTDYKNTQDNIILSDNIFEGRIQPYRINNLKVSYNQVSGIDVWRSSGYVSYNTMDDVNMGIGVMFCDGLTVQDNTIAAQVGENTDAGIFIDGSSNIVVIRNTITGFQAGERKYYTYGTKGAGIAIYSSSANIDVMQNNIEDNSVGIFVFTPKTGETPTGVEIHSNDIAGNLNYGVCNFRLPFPPSQDWKYWEYEKFLPATSAVNARSNWWGHPGGPLRLNPDDEWAGPKTADRVSRNVDYHPWLHKQN